MLGHPGVCHSEIMRLAITILGSCRGELTDCGATKMLGKLQAKRIYLMSLFIVKEVPAKKHQNIIFIEAW